MKIICFIDSLGSGGAQRQMVNLAKGFKERGHEVIVLNYHKLNFFKTELDIYGIPVKTILERNYLKRILKIRQTIREERPDAVLSFLGAGNFIATIAGLPFKRWKLVVGERNADPRIFKSIKLRFFIFFHLFADYVVANSYANIRIIKKINPFLKKDRLKILYNILDLKQSKNNLEEIESEKIHIVVAARYHSQKNLQGLIQALTKLPQNYKNCLEISWYGEIAESPLSFKENLKLIENNNLEKIIFLNDRTTSVFEKYQRAHFVGLFSHYEGFPNTICEALAIGKPVICTRVSDVPLFLKDGVNGFLCDSKDPESIKNALIRAIDSTTLERSKMSEENKKVINSEMFDKNKIINEYLKLLGAYD